MKKYLILLFVTLLPMLANAYDAKIDGIYYNFLEDEAWVALGSPKYSGAVIIPASVTYDGKDFCVTSIGEYAFYDCSGLTDVWCYAESVPSTDSYFFSYSSISSATLHVPAESIEKYRATKPGSRFGTIVALTDEVAVTEVRALPVLIQTQGGIISIQGAAEGTPIAIYNTSGKQYGSAIAGKDCTAIQTSLQSGSTVIVKIG